MIGRAVGGGVARYGAMRCDNLYSVDCIVLYCTVLCCVVLYSTVFDVIEVAWRSILLCCMALPCIVM